MRISAMTLALALLLPAGLVAQANGTAATAAPTHRRHHAVAYDPASQRVLLFGGQSLISNTETPVLDDLWSWDGSQWSSVANRTGIAMLGHKLFAEGSGHLFALGNARGAGEFNGAVRSLTLRWSPSGRRWDTVSVDSPIRESAAGAYDVARRRYVLFGGLAGMRLAGDTWEFDGQRWDRVAVDGPPASLGGAMVFDSRRGVVLLFGGIDSTGHRSGNTWTWNDGRWTRLAVTGPAPRFGAGMAFDAARGEAILFGGVDSTGQKLNDTWRWDGQAWRAAESATRPPARSEGYMAYDTVRHVVVMFGGEGSEVVPTLGDTWEWDGTGWRRIDARPVR